MAVAVITRMYNFWSLPLMHDEFSALFRARFDNFNDLIEYGVKVDGHPPLIQIYYYFVVNTFGEIPWIIKLPFVLMGIASVWLTYVIAKKEFNVTTGLITSAIICVSEMGVMYSHLARPYISGLFFVLLASWFWLKIIQKPEQKYLLNSLGFIVFSVFACYNHHFSLLAIALMGLAGLVLIERNYLLKYVLSGGVIALFYLPNLTVFMAQIKLGGIGQWLSPPDEDFLLGYLGFVLNFNIFFYFLTGILMFLAFTFLRHQENNLKWIFTNLGLFVFAFLIGFLYSTYVNPVLQFSVLIFFLPFLLMGLIGTIKNLSFKWNALIVLGILIVGTFSLVSSRGYYKYNYSSPYISILDDCRDAQSKFPGTPAVIHSHYRISKFYLDEQTEPIHFLWADSLKNIASFESFVRLSAATHKHFYFGAMSDVKPEFYNVISNHFPTICWQRNYFGATTYLFSKGRVKHNYLLDLTFENSDLKKQIPINREQIVLNSTNNSYLLKDKEWCLESKTKIQEKLSHKNQFIDARVDVKLPHASTEVLLVLSLLNNEETIVYKAMSTKSYPKNNGEFRTLYTSIKLSDVQQINESTVLKCFIWNKNKSAVEIDNYQIVIRDGNPIIYGMFNPLP